MFIFATKFQIIRLAFKRIISSLLLFLFILGNMPRQFLHDYFASHKDEIEHCTHKNQKGCIHHQTFYCHFEKFFVANDFFTTIAVDINLVPFQHTVSYLTHSVSPVSACRLLSGNKGPPSFS